MDGLKQQAFLAIPFDRRFDRVTEEIREVCLRYGLRLIRIDEKHESKEITQDIYDEIQSSQVVIADLSEEKKGNVFFELGYACGKEKPIIVITRDVSKLPFDIRNFRAIQYTTRNLDNLFEEVSQKLNCLVEEEKVVDGWNIVGQWETALRKQQNFGNDWTFKRKIEKNYQQFYKNSWSMPELFVHFEFLTNMKDLLNGGFTFMIEVERKNKSEFIKLWKNSLTDEQINTLHEREIEITPRRTNKVIAYKNVECNPELKDFCNCICETFKEFEFLIPSIDTVIEKYKDEND